MPNLNQAIANFLVRFPSVSPDFRNLLQDISNKPYLPDQQDLDAISDKQKRLALLNKKVEKPLDRMHRDLITNIKKYIDNSGLSDTSVAMDMLAENIMLMGAGQVTAYDQPAIQSFMKLLTAYALLDHDKKLSPQIATKVGEWYTNSQPIFTEMKLNALQKNSYKYLTDTAKEGKIHPKLLLVNDNLKNIRKAIHENLTGKKANIFHKENSLSLAYLSNLMTYYNSASDNAYRHIVNNIGILKEPLFTGEVEPEAKLPVDQAMSNLKAHTAKHGGKGLMLTDDQEAKLKAKKPEEHKEYRKHVLAVRDGRRAEIKKMVRASGADKLPVKTIESNLKKIGLPTNFIPIGFDGFYDENSNMYARNGKQFAANIDGGRYIPNPTYDPKRHGHQYIGTHDNPRAKIPQKIYTTDHKQDSHDDRQVAVKENAANLSEYKDTWRHDMNTAKPPHVTLAHLVEAMYQTSSRIGSRDDGGLAKGIKTYGLRTILVRHVKTYANGNIVIHFPGKDAMHQTFKIKPDEPSKVKLIDYIKKKMTNKKLDHPVWTLGSSQTEMPSASSVNKYMQDMGWKGGLHKFRHIRGAELAVAYMKKHKTPTKMTKKELETYVKDLGTTVGQILGHQRTLSTGKTEPVGTTALKSYIDPQLIADLYKSKQVPVPAWLEKALKGLK